MRCAQPFCGESRRPWSVHFVHEDVFMSRFRVHLFPYLVCLAVAGFLAPESQSQILTTGDDTTTPVEGAGHDYIKMLSETVNPANGSVSLRVEVPVARGRGI